MINKCGLKYFLFVFFLFIVLFQTNSVDKSFIFVDKGDIQRAQDLDPDIGWDEGYGFDAVELDNYNENASFSSKEYRGQIYVTDVVGNKVVYSIGDNDTDDYGKEAGQITFSSPHGIAGHRDGSVWVADTGNNRVIKLTCDGYEMTHNGIIITGLNHPWGVEVDDAGNVYIADSGSGYIYKYDKNGNPLNDYKGTNYFSYLDHINGFLSNPLDVAVDTNGRIFVVDANNRLSIFNSDGILYKSIKLSEIGFSNSKAESVDVDKYGNVYVLDKNNRYLIKLDSDLNYIDHFGGAGDGDYNFEADVNSISVYGKRGGLGVSTDYGGKLYRIGPGLHDTILDQTVYSPYEGELKIEYKITSESALKVFILNDLNDFVREIQSSDFEKIGEHTVYWDGKDTLGYYAPNGNYRVKIVAHTAVETPFGQEIELPFNINYTARIDLVSANPGVIDSINNFSTLKYDLSKNARPVITIMKKDLFDNSDISTDITVLHQPSESETEGSHYINYDGKDGDGNDLPDYLYYFTGKIDGSASPTDYLKIGIDKNPIVGEITHIENYFNPNNGPLNIVYRATEDCYLSIDLIKNGTKVLGVLNRGQVKSGVNSYQWNGKEEDGDIIDEGEYVIRLLFEDITGNSTKSDEKKIYVNSDAPYIRELFVSPLVFASSIYKKQTTALYYLLSDSFYDYSLERPEVSITLYNEFGDLIKEILSSQLQKPGMYSYNWDGTAGDNLTYVPDGAYYFEISVSDSTNNAKKYKQNVIKNTVVSEIKSPSNNEVLKTNNVNIIGTAMNLLSFKKFTLDYAEGEINDGEIGSVEWKGIKVLSELISNAYPDDTSVLQVQDGLLANWDTTALKKGKYTLKLSVYDRDNTAKNVLRIVEIDNPLYIANLRTENSIATPDGDGFQDIVKTYFDLSKNASVKVNIYNKNGTDIKSDDTLVKTINLGSLNETLVSGTSPHVFEWDCKNNSDVIQPDGMYRLEITATRLLVDQDVKEVTIGIVSSNSSDISASINSINDIDLNNDVPEIAGKRGTAFSYKARFDGSYYPAKKIKLLLSVKGIETKYTVDVPVYGGPRIIDNYVMYSEAWDGVRDIDFFEYLDNQGKPVIYDAPLSCILDGGNVSQVTGFNTVGETSGQLKIFYQNISDLSNAPRRIFKTIDLGVAEIDFELDEDARNAFALINVNINKVDSFASGFNPYLYNEPHVIELSEEVKELLGLDEGFAMGTMSKVWFYANAPVTYYGNIPYNNSVSLIGLLNTDGSNSFEIKLDDGTVLTDKEVKNILFKEELNSIIDKNYTINVVGVANDINENAFLDSPTLLNGINAYFESKESVSEDRNSTLLDDDKIILSAYPADWQSKMDTSLSDGYYYGPDYIFDQSSDGFEKTINITYNEPGNVTLNEKGIKVIILDSDNEISKDFDSPIIIDNKTFKITPSSLNSNDNKLLDIRGSIDCDNLDYYMLSCYNEAGNNVFVKKYSKLIENRLGVIDFTDLAEGEYSIVLDVFAKDGNVKKIKEDFVYVETFDPKLLGVVSENQKIKIDYSLNEESVVTLQIVDSTTDDVIKTLVYESTQLEGEYKESWDGFDNNSTPDNINDDSFMGFKEYTVRLTVQDKDFIGTEYQKSIIDKKVILEDVEINPDVTISTDLLSPDGDGINDEVKILYKADEPFTTNIDVFNNDNDLVKSLISSQKYFSDEYSTSWDGYDESSDLVENGYYTIKVEIYPLDGGNSRTFTFKIKVKPNVTVNPSVIDITYPEENDIISSTSGTLFSYKANPIGQYYPPQTINYAIYRDGFTRHIMYKSETYGFSWRKTGDWLEHKFNTFVFREPGWQLLGTTGPHSDGFECSPSGGKYFFQYTPNRPYQDQVTEAVEFYYSKFGQTNYLRAHVHADWRRPGYTLWTKHENGSVSGVTIRGKEVEIPENLTEIYPERPSNLVDTSSIKYFSSYWDNRDEHVGQYINIFPEENATGTRIAGDKFKIVSQIHQDWIDTRQYIGANYPILFDERDFNPDADENSYTVDLFALHPEALTAEQYIEKDVDFNGWKVNINSPNDTAFIINKDNVSLQNPRQLTNDGITVTVGTDATVDESGKFKVILDKNIEKKFLKIKGNASTSINSYKVLISKGRDVADAVWKEIYQQNGKPANMEDGKYIFYNWDVTNLYGPYMILLRVEKDSGTVEVVRKIKLGNRVTRGSPSVATSPYKKATLGFPPFAIPANVEDEDPSTPEIDVNVDIIPISADLIDQYEEGMSIVGPVFDMKPSGLKFDKPVTLKYKYTDDELQNWAESLGISTDRLESRLGSYHVYKDDEGIERLEYMPGYIDKQNNVLTVLVYSFSKYALVYDDNVVNKPEINHPGVYSNFGYIDLEGKTSIGNKVKIYKNGLDQDNFVGYANVDDNGELSYKDLRLDVGVNKIYAVAVNKRNIESEAALVEIIFDNKNPEIEIVDIKNEYFSPNNDGINDKFKVKFKLNEDGKIQYVLNSSLGLKVDSGEYFVSENVDEIYEWDGRVNGVLQEEGEYTLVLSAYDKAGNAALYDFDNMITIKLDNTPPRIEKIDIYNDHFSPNNDGVKDDCFVILKTDDNLSNELYYDISIKDENNVVVNRLMNYEKNSTGILKQDIKGEELGDGNFNGSIKVYDLAGNSSVINEFNIHSDTAPPAPISTIKLAYDYFSPNGDNNKDTLPVYFDLNKDSDVYITIYKSPENILNSIKLENQKGNRSHIYSFDGKDQDGHNLSEGKYTLKVTITDVYGNTLSKDLFFTIDNTPPVSNIASPATGTTITSIFDIIGTADDNNFDYYLLELKDDSTTDNYIEIGRNHEAINNDALCNVDSGILNGEYTIKLTSFDKAGNTSSSSTSVSFSNPEEKAFLTLELFGKSIISPKNGDELSAVYELLEDSTVSIYIKQDDTTLQTLKDNVDLTSDSYLIKFNGKNDLGNYYPDGSYRLLVSATNNSTGINAEKYIDFIIDSNLPQVIIDSPVNNSYVNDVITITGDLIEDNLSQCYIEYGYGDSPTTYMLLNELSKTGRDIEFATIDTKTLADDQYTFRVTAIDKAGNKVEDVKTYTIDNRKPLIEIQSPQNNTYVSNEDIEINANITDTTNVNYSLEYKLNSSDTWNSIRNGSINKQGIINETLNKELISEDFSIRLTATDVSGNEASVELFLFYDDSPPVVIITEPTTDSYADASLNIIGTISDDNLEKYTLSIGEGITPVKYEEVFRAYDNVVDDTIYILDTLALVGDYTLKIEAIDKSGKETVATVSFKADSIEPSVKINSPIAGFYSGDIEIKADIDDNSDIVSYQLLYGEGENPTVYNELYSGSGKASGNIYTWDTSALDGEYTLLLKAQDTRGNDGFDKVVISLDNTAPELNDISLSNEYFHPLSPINNSVLSMNILEDSYLTFELFDNNGVAKGKLLDKYYYGKGYFSYTITGKVDEYTILEDGDYTLKINASDEAGNTREEEVHFSIIKDIQAPDAKVVKSTALYISPNNDNVKDDTYINVLINDDLDNDIIANFYIMNSENLIVKKYDELVLKPGEVEIYWDGNDNNGVLLPDDKYRLAVKLTDKLQNKNDVILTPISIDTVKPVISTLALSEEFISPNYDGVQDYLKITFNLNEDVTADFDLHYNDLNNEIIHKLTNNDIYKAGVQKFIWMGEGVVDDGVYKFVIRYADLAGNIGIEQYGSVFVDNTPPDLSLDETPYYVKENVLLKGSLIEDNLREYEVSYREVSSNDWTLLKHSTDYPVDNNIGNFDTLSLSEKEGLYLLKFTATDDGGTVTTLKKLLRVDNLMPTATLSIVEEPYHNIDNNTNYYKGLLTIKADVNDNFLDSYKLYHVNNSNNEEIEIPLITNGSSNIENKEIAKWNTNNINGDYTIKLVVVDKSGNERIVENNIKIDSLKPEITNFNLNPLIMSPINNDGQNDKTISSFNTNEDVYVKTKVISSNKLYNWQAVGHGSRYEYTDQTVDFNINVDGYQIYDYYDIEGRSNDTFASPADIGEVDYYVDPLGYDPPKIEKIVEGYISDKLGDRDFYRFKAIDQIEGAKNFPASGNLPGKNFHVRVKFLKNPENAYGIRIWQGNAMSDVFGAYVYKQFDWGLVMDNVFNDYPKFEKDYIIEVVKHEEITSSDLIYKLEISNGKYYDFALEPATPDQDASNDSSVTWHKTLKLEGISLNARSPLIIDIPDELLLDGLEIDPIGNPSTFSISNINNSKVNIEVKEYTEGPMVGRHYIEVTAKPESIIVDNEWETPLLQGNNYIISENEDNSHNIYNETGYSLPVSSNVDINIDKWDVDLVKFDGNSTFNGAYVVEADANGFIPTEDFNVRASGNAGEIKQFDEYLAYSGLVNNILDDWDGTTQNNTSYVPDGDYLYFSEVFDMARNRSFVMKNINVDNTNPVVGLEDVTGIVFEPLRINGSAYDSNRFKSYEINIFDNNNNLIKNIVKSNPIINDELYYWDPTGLVADTPQDFKIVLSAIDDAYNRSEIEKTVTIGKIDSVISLYSNLQYITPKTQTPGTQNKEAEINFGLLGDARISIEVYDNSSFTGVPVRTILKDTVLSIGEYLDTYAWDGKDDNDLFVADAKYFIKVEASAISTPDITHSRRLDIVVDNGINIARIDSPSNNQYINNGLVNINVSIDEANLLYYRLSYKKANESEDSYREILKSSSTAGFPLNNKKIFEFIIPPEDDDYNIKLEVFDLANNKAEDVIKILKDISIPEVKLYVNEGYEYNDSRIVSGNINVSGSVFDRNIREYRLLFNDGSTLIEYAKGNTNIEDSIILSNFDTTTFNDGVYELVLEATDNNNQVASISKKIRIDNTSPQITIISPSENDLVSGEVNIDFDLDEYLADNYVIEYRKTGTTDEWETIIKRDYSEGVINRWNTDQLNGLYTLNVKVTDVVGNINQEEINIVIDNKLPTAVINSPLTSEVLSGNVTISGIAKDDNFDNGILSYKKVDADNFIEFANFDVISDDERELGILDGTLLEDGEYIIKLSVMDKAGNINEGSINILIDNQIPNIEISSPAENSINENMIDIYGTIEDFTIDKYTLSLGEGTNPVDFELLSEGTTNINNALIYSFNSHEQGKIYNGEYVIRIEAIDKMGRIATVDVPIFIDNIEPEINALSLKYLEYSPYDDLQEITVSVSEKSYIFAKIVDQSDNLIFEIANNKLFENKDFDLTWDGTDINHEYLDNGNYKFVIHAVDFTGKNSLTSEKSFEYIIDNLPPEIKNVTTTAKYSPNYDGYYDFANIFFDVNDNRSSTINVDIEVFDANDELVYTLADNVVVNAGNNGNMWFGLNNEGNIVDDGLYYLIITARDGTGNETSYKTDNIIVDNTIPSIHNYILQPDIISPDSDGINDNLNINFELSDNNLSSFDVRVTLLNIFNEEIGTIYKTKDNENTNYSTVWNGQDNTGDVVKDGVYRIKVEAWDDVLNKNEGILELRSDKTLPEVIIHETEQVFMPADETNDKKNYFIITGHIYDANLLEYNVYYSKGSDNNWQLIYTDTENKEYYDATDDYWPELAEWDVTGFNGIYNLKIEAIDIAGLITSKTITFELDSVEPTSELVIRDGLYEDYYTNANNEYSILVTDPSVDGYSSGTNNTYYCIEKNDTTSDFMKYTSPFSITEHGKYNIFYFSTDIAGNREVDKNGELFVDAILPVIDLTDDGIFYNNGENRYGALNNSYIITAIDNDSGLEGIYYNIIDDEYIKGSSPVTITFSDEGEKVIKYYAKDNVDNTTDTYSYSVIVDATAPVTDLTSDKDVLVWENSNYADPDIKFTLSSKDVLSGVKTIHVSIDGSDFVEYDGSEIGFVERGEHTIRYYSVDNVDNVEDIKAYTIITPKPDKTSPLTVVIPNGYIYTDDASNDYCQPSVGFELVAEDTLGAGDGYVSGVDYTEYRIDNNPEWTRYITPIYLDEGVHTLEFRSYDRIPNVEETKIYIINVDDTVPETVDNYTNRGNWIANDINITLTASDPENDGVSSGVKILHYEIDGIAGDVSSDNVSFNVTKDGITTISYYAEDNVGNAEIEKELEVKIDKTSPDLDLGYNGSIYESGEKIYGALDNAYVINANDNASGLESIYYSINGNDYIKDSSPVVITFSEEGANVINYYAKDNVGNTTDVYSYAVTIDATAPVADLTSDKGILLWNGNNYAEPDIKFTLSSVDALSGVKAIYFNVDGSGFVEYVSGSKIGFAEEGEHTISYYSVDNVGNVEDIRTFKVITPFPDRTPPVTTLTPTGFVYTSNDDKLYATSVVGFELTAEDIIGQDDGYATGVDYIEYRIDGADWVRYINTIYLDEGIHTVEYRSYDMIPNVEEIKSYTINIDDTKPITYDNYQNKDKWINYSVGITIYSNDPGNKGVSSGIKTLHYSVDGVEDDVTSDTVSLNIDKEGITIVSYYSEDNVGNVETEKEFEVKIDKTSPEIEIDGVVDSFKYGKDGVTPVITVYDVNLDSVAITLLKDNSSEESFVSGTHISEQGNYKLRVVAVDFANNVSEEIVDFNIDLTSPSNPENITYVINKETILINWSKVNDVDLLGYNVYRNGIKINANIIENEYFTDNPGIGSYIYKITSIDDVYNESNGKEITITLEKAFEITHPDNYDNFNVAFLLRGNIYNNNIRNLNVSYGEYKDENQVPSNWIDLGTTRSFMGRMFVKPILSKFIDDGKYIFKVSTKLSNGVALEDSVRLGIDNTPPVTKMFIEETGEYYDVTSDNYIKEVDISTPATITFVQNDPIVNDFASGVKKTLYKVIKKGKMNHGFIWGRKYAWQEWHQGDDPIELESNGTYYIVYCSIDNTKYFGNIERIKTIKLNIKKQNTLGQVDEYENFYSSFSGLSIVRPPQQNYKGDVVIDYPILLPPGISDMKPDVTLRYNSSKSDTGYGAGWNIIDTFISKEQSSGDYYLNYNGEEILLAKIGTNKYVPKDLCKFIAIYKIDTHWELYDKNGTKYTLGNTTNSYLNTVDIQMWAIDKAIDMNGNYIEYIYSISDDKIRPVEIYYTGNKDNTPVYNIRFAYEEDKATIAVNYNDEQIRKYELVYNSGALNSIRQYNGSDTNYYKTDFIYSKSGSLIQIENPISGVIKIGYNNNKMSEVSGYNEKKLLFSEKYEYANQGDVVVKKIINNKNYSESYYHTDSGRKDKLFKYFQYKDGKLARHLERHWNERNGQTCLSDEQIISYDNQYSLKQVRYQYDDYNNIIKIEYIGETGTQDDDKEYVAEYLNNNINGIDIRKVSHSYWLLKRKDIKFDEKWFYYDDKGLGEIENGNLTKVTYFDSNGRQSELSFKYNEIGKIIESVKNNSIRQYYYDVDTYNYLTRIISNTNEIKTEYDPRSGFIKYLKDNNNEITYEYDANYNLTGSVSTGKDNYTTDIVYTLDDDPEINIIKRIGGYQYKVDLKYDNLGRISEVVYPDDYSVSYEYDNGLLNKIESERYHRDEYIKDVEYDALNNRNMIEYGDGYEYYIDLFVSSEIQEDINSQFNKVSSFANSQEMNDIPLNVDYFAVDNRRGIIKFIYDNNNIIAKRNQSEIEWLYPKNDEMNPEDIVEDKIIKFNVPKIMKRGKKHHIEIECDFKGRREIIISFLDKDDREIKTKKMYVDKGKKKIEFDFDFDKDPDMDYGYKWRAVVKPDNNDEELDVIYEENIFVDDEEE